jgi:protein-S-isoprenylcysteine O-methyltransferase Ste14
MWNIVDKKTVYQILFGISVLLGLASLAVFVMSIISLRNNIVPSGIGVFISAFLLFGTWWKIKEAKREEIEADKKERRLTNKDITDKKDI